MLTCEDILKQSPVYGKGLEYNMAFYSVRCCWWTSDAMDLGEHYHSGYIDGSKSASLPCCPHCGSMLMEAPLIDFICSALRNPSFYGKYGIKTFEAAYHKNSPVCYTSWDKYNDMLDMALAAQSKMDELKLFGSIDIVREAYEKSLQRWRPDELRHG